MRLACDGSGRLGIDVPEWPGFHLGGLCPALRVNGADVGCTGNAVVTRHAAGFSVAWAVGPCRLEMRADAQADGSTVLTSTLVNTGNTELLLEDVALLQAAGEFGSVAFGNDPTRIRLLEQGNYWGRVRPLASTSAPQVAVSAAEPGGAPLPQERASDLVSVVYDPVARQALLVGFLASERWLGRIQVRANSAGSVSRWCLGFDGGALRVAPGERLPLEPVLILSGNDPWGLLLQYADAVSQRHHPPVPAEPVVSWCSWYPYRLGVTEERILAEAHIAAARLKALGLKIMEVDLGWESQNLPCAFAENERFPHGLKWLAERLRELGFDLGAWKAPYTISEFDPLAKAHPEWLIPDETGRPLAYWEWFWEPHGKVHILDLTHAGALHWLRESIQSLTKRGVRYLKFDFIGCAADGRAKQRHNRRLVMGAGTEAARRAAAVIREAAPEALILNCGGPEMPGTGQWPLLYVCNDTGNSGFIGHEWQAGNYETLACHLFKNRRWGLIQPSCLVVGLPGTAEDARLRATIAFLAGGQIDISDTLTTLPEERWQILTATLPAAPASATPVDLFEPLSMVPFDYEGTCRGQQAVAQVLREYPPGSVWHLHMTTDWDEWDLVGIFCFGPGSSATKPEMSRYLVPLARLGIPDATPRWGYEFWSGQFLGVAPGQRRNPGGYVHPGDYQDLLVGDTPGMLDVAFFGPGAKLICLRRPRLHPWVLGSSFHQSCGLELRKVHWDAATHCLGGELHRPPGESGYIALATGGHAPAHAEVDGRATVLRSGASGSCLLPLVVGRSSVAWRVEFTAAARP